MADLVCNAMTLDKKCLKSTNLGRFSPAGHWVDCKTRGKVIAFIIIGASLSKPHMNGTAVHEFYIICRSRKIYARDGCMDISAKYYCAHSHAWATGHSNLMNSNRIAVTIATVRRKEKETTQGQLDVQLQTIARRSCTEATLHEGIILSRQGDARLYLRHIKEISLHDLVIHRSVSHQGQLKKGRPG